MGKGQESGNLNEQELSLLEACEGQLMLFRLRGPLSFGAAKGISARMGLISNYKVLILDITEVPRIGVTAALAMERMVEEAESLGRLALVAGANKRLHERLTKFGIRQIVTKRIQALEIAYEQISQT